MLFDRLIIGVQDKKLQLKLLESKNKQLEDIINECKAFEAAAKNNELLKKAVTQKASVESNTINAVVRRCYNCGAIFNPNHLAECRAKETTCYACGRSGHFAKHCKRQKKRVGSNNNINKQLDNNSNANGKVEVERKRTTGSSINWLESVCNLPTTREQFVEKFRYLFEGLGKLPNKQTIVLKDDAKPVLHYKKRFPHSLLKALEQELQAMVKDEIISPVTYPTSWVNNLQIVEKPNGKLRLCLDPKPLNDAIKREHYLIPTIDDFMVQLSRKKVFTILDLSHGFWQMELEEASFDYDDVYDSFRPVQIQSCSIWNQ
ncbi:hypothetical protein ACLKA6_001118 [Drosophila palustris]